LIAFSTANRFPLRRKMLYAGWYERPLGAKCPLVAIFMRSLTAC
jgi:hypothetical protein